MIFVQYLCKKVIIPLEIDFMEQKGSERLRMYYKNNEEDEWKFMYFDMFFTK